MLMYITVVNMFQVVMNNSSKHVTEIFHDSTHALNVAVLIMRAVLFCHLIRKNCTLYIALDQISQISDILIYPAIIGKNIIRTIIQALMTFSTPVTYGEQATLWIILCKVSYWV